MRPTRVTSPGLKGRRFCVRPICGLLGLLALGWLIPAESVWGQDSPRRRMPSRRAMQDNLRRGEMDRGNTAVVGARALLTWLDTDRNGSLSNNELSRVEAKLRELDRNGDGTVDQRELTGGLRRLMTDRPAGDRPNRPDRDNPPSDRVDPVARLDRLFEQRDANGDGLLAGDELPQPLAQRMEQLDANGDGQLSRDELSRRIRDRGNRRPGGDVPRRGNEGDRREAMRNNADPAQLVTRLFSRFDQDQDGQLSREEVPQNLSRGFDRIDASGDGQLSKEEVTNAMQQMRRGGDRGAETFDGVKPKRPAKKSGDGDTGDGS